MNVKTIFLLTGLSFFKFGSGQVASKYYAIANNYLDTSILVKRQLSRLIPKYEMSSCKKNKSLLYFCPIVNFINLSEYKELIIDSAESFGLMREELKDWSLYRKKHYFKPYEDSAIFLLNRKKNGRYCFYSSFSKMQGRTLAISIFLNDSKKNENPCNLLTSIKFGRALTVIFLFDKKFSKIDTAFFSQVALN